MAIKFSSRRNFIKRVFYGLSSIFVLRSIPTFADNSAAEEEWQEEGFTKTGSKKVVKKKKTPPKKGAGKKKAPPKKAAKKKVAGT